MKKKRGIEKSEAIFQIVNLVVAILAFSFLVSLSTPVVSSYTDNEWIEIVAKDLDLTNQQAADLLGLKYKPHYGSPFSKKIAGFGAKERGRALFQPGSGPDALLSGLMWAFIAYTAVSLIGPIFGIEGDQVDALAKAAAVGFGLGRGLYVGTEIGKWGAVGVGLVVGLIILDMLWQEKDEKIVSFSCHPWEAPEKGADCEECNSDIYPCTEYRCKSLGQACVLLNRGTGEEKCAWNASSDVIPPVISTWDEPLNRNHIYSPDVAISPPDNGVKILYEESSDGCVKAFTPLSFGIVTSEPAQCKIDSNRTDKFEEMMYYFGGSNIYKYNHTQTLSLPGPEHVNAEAPELENDGEYNLYVRCKDANGNENTGMFVFNFCVEKGPDLTPPEIVETSITNNAPIQYGVNETEIEIYVNEPSDCRWSKIDQAYDNMEETMTCSSHIYEMNNLMLYTCTTTLKGLEDRKDNNFYFRCRDQPLLGESLDRNTMEESYLFTLIGTQPLNIIDVLPESDSVITSAATLAPVYIEMETDNGYNFGDSWCSYSDTGDEDDFVEMFETGETNLHKQRLDLVGGEHTYYLKCVDLGGNSDTSNVTFNVEIDTEAPKVVRVYKEGLNLKVSTDENSTCTYSTNKDRKCNFILEEAKNMPQVNTTEHYAEWQTRQTYYIKCKDVNNKQPLPNQCSVIVKPINL
jgi:hypothetical protein